MGASYSLEKHGNFNQDLYDSYLSSPTKFNAQEKLIAITGTTTGSIGYYVAQMAVAQNAKHILLLNRPSERSITAETNLKEFASENQSTTIVQTVPIDLLSFDSVKKAARQVKDIANASGGLDVLCCNAGIMARNDDRSEDGYEVQMQANMLSHYLLTRLCFESLELASSSRGEARIVFHSSSARYGQDLERKYFESSESGSLGGNDASNATTTLGVL